MSKNFSSLVKVAEYINKTPKSNLPPLPPQPPPMKNSHAYTTRPRSLSPKPWLNETPTTPDSETEKRNRPTTSEPEAEAPPPTKKKSKVRTERGANATR